MSEDRIPSLIKIGAIPSSYGQKLHTDVIDPVTFSQRRVRFTLSRVAGFLHSNSKVTLAITPQAGVSQGFYPLNVGVSQLIKNAQLTIGNNTVCSVDDYNQFHAYQSMFISNEDNKEREQFLSQRCIAHMPVYDDRTENTTDKPPNSAKRIGIDVGRYPVVPAAGGVGAFELLPFMEQDGTSAQTISEAPVYSVYLSDLFPFLKFNQLPMFMLDDEVHIDLTFVDATSSLSGAVKSQRCCVNNGDADTLAFDVNESECKLIYDSITYDGDIMEKYAQQNPKLTFQYADYRLTKRTGVKDAGTAVDDFANVTLPIGGNGRLCTKVIFGLQANNNFVAKSLVNGTAAFGDNGLSYNLLYNDRFEFSVDRTNSALQFATTQAAEGAVPMLTHDEIVKRSGTSSITAETLEGHAQASKTVGLETLFRWNSVRPNKGERINNKGMDLIYKIPSGLSDDTYTLRVYIELLKVATIENGRFNCYFA
tara:strand:+ start:2287 stop:3723 length:1437 start_codon:yes stop_codon:yes gene_type:complete